MEGYDYIIVGAGPTGVIAAGTLRAWKPDYKVAVVEPGQLMGSLLEGGLRYLRAHEDVLDLLSALRLKYDTTPVRGGVLLAHSARVVPYPEGLDRTQRGAAQRLHYHKTRGTLIGFNPNTTMNFGGAPVERVNVCFRSLVESCLRRSDLFRLKATGIGGNGVTLEDGTRLTAQKGVISTIPLFTLLQIQGVPAVDCPLLSQRWTTVLTVGSLSLFDVSPWDYIYTPWLLAINRISKLPNGEIQLELNSQTSADWTADLRYLQGRAVSDERALPGYIAGPEWRSWKPAKGLTLLGRYAAWEPRFTVDQAVSRVRSMG